MRWFAPPASRSCSMNAACRSGSTLTPRGRIEHVPHMCNPDDVSKMIQVRNVPDRLHRELVRRAKARGQALTDYIQDLLEREIERPPMAEVLDRIESSAPVS